MKGTLGSVLLFTLAKARGHVFSTLGEAYMERPTEAPLNSQKQETRLVNEPPRKQILQPQSSH